MARWQHSGTGLIIGFDLAIGGHFISANQRRLDNVTSPGCRCARWDPRRRSPGSRAGRRQCLTGYSWRRAASHGARCCTRPSASGSRGRRWACLRQGHTRHSNVRSSRWAWLRTFAKQSQQIRKLRLTRILQVPNRRVGRQLEKLPGVARVDVVSPLASLPPPPE